MTSFAFGCFKGVIILLIVLCVGIIAELAFAAARGNPEAALTVLVLGVCVTCGFIQLWTDRGGTN